MSQADHLPNDGLGPGLVDEQRLAHHAVVGTVRSGDVMGIGLLESAPAVPAPTRERELIRIRVEAVDASAGRDARPQERAKLAGAAAEVGHPEPGPQRKQGAQAIRPRAPPEVLPKDGAQKAQPALSRAVCDCSLIRPRCETPSSFGYRKVRDRVVSS